MNDGLIDLVDGVVEEKEFRKEIREKGWSSFSRSFALSCNNCGENKSFIITFQVRGDVDNVSIEQRPR